MRDTVLTLLCLISGTMPCAVAADAPTGYHVRVGISKPTSLDWVFAIANQSPVEAPASWLDGYSSEKQEYELFVPGNSSPKVAHPVVLFISASGNPAGWGNWRSVCEQRGILFASPYGAGNEASMPTRVRLALDVLDDVRRKYRTDPDRTYIAGFSGGGRVAAAIAFGLPEYFGGVIPVCASGDLREELWLRQRTMDRLSVALITGEQDFNRGEVSRLRGPMLTGMGVRTRVWTVPHMGHQIPPADQFEQVLDWLEEALPARRRFAEKYPASRVAADQALSRDEWATALLAEGKSRLKTPKTLYSGLMQLKGVAARWPDLPAATEATRLLSDYDARPVRPWEEDDIAEQRRSLIARARAIDAYASGELPPQYAAMRPDMLEAAIELWRLVLQDGQDAPAVAEAKRRIPALEKLQQGEDE